jgi:signal transduction histidine kinase/DNA-binding NarL/FixJ family response regulator
MKTILVLSSHPDFIGAVQAGLPAEEYRTVERFSVEDAEPLLAHGLVNACILDASLTGVEAIWAIERLRRFNKKIPILVFTEAMQAGWEEEAFLRGVNHVLTKPVRSRLLVTLLEHSAATPAVARPAANASNGTTSFFRSASAEAAAGRPAGASQTLDVLRGFSPILTHSLDAEAMLKRFLQFLREILSINRAAIFLNRPGSPFTGGLTSGEGRELRAAASIGINAGLLEQFELSLDSGIGAQVTRLGRILRRDGDAARLDAEVQKEFELLGGQVAVPISNRDTTVGVAVFDGRITGEPLVNSELELIFHLLEQVGMALNNIWLHDQLSGNHEMMASVLRELNSACVVVSRDLKVLHANKSARRHFGRRHERAAGLEFSDLPPMLGAKVYQVLKTGAALEPFRYQPETAPGTVLKVTILPFQHGNMSVPVSALLVAEDLTESEQLSRLETEAGKLRLIRSMADRMTHEIGNAIVPISVFQELVQEKYGQGELAESFEQASLGVQRVSRLVNQMRFLASEGNLKSSEFPVPELVEEAFREAARQHGSRGAKLMLEKPPGPLNVYGDRSALKHALAEIILNAMQDSPQDSKIGIRLAAAGGAQGPSVTIEVRDDGRGFSSDSARKIPEPFFTTRTTGLGLGLTVSQKIIENHHGRLEIVPSETGVVRVSLPLDSGAA